jgi:hypothetical protein
MLYINSSTHQTKMSTHIHHITSCGRPYHIHSLMYSTLNLHPSSAMVGVPIMVVVPYVDVIVWMSSIMLSGFKSFYRIFVINLYMVQLTKLPEKMGGA